MDSLSIIPDFLNARFPRPIIRYKLNSKGYRTVEFDKIDYNNSIFLFGCSMTFGQGLEEDETISSRLEQILKVPVINLGVRGSSITFSVYNQILLKEINCKPKAIINLWTNAARIVYFQNNLARHLGSWTTKTEKNQYTYYSSWSYDQSNMDTSNKLNRKIAKLIWHDVPHIEASYFPDTIKLLDIQGLIQVDNSLSGRHPGPKTAIITAEYLSNEYKNLV